MSHKFVAVVAIVGLCLLPSRSGHSTVAVVAEPPPAEIVEAILPEIEIPTVSVDAMVAAAVDDCAAGMPAAQRESVTEAVLTESHRHGYDPLFIQAMLEVESACDPHALGGGGSIGLIQLRPTTAKSVAAEAGVRWNGPSTLREPTANIRLGVYYLSQLEERFSDPYLALAAYNLGPTRVAQLPRARARRSIYVRKVLNRYHELLLSHATHES